MKQQLDFAFQPKATDDDGAFVDGVWVPSHDLLMRYAAGEVSGDEIGLHNYYSCQRVPCPQCDARQDACYEFEAAIDEFFEGIE